MYSLEQVLGQADLDAGGRAGYYCRRCSFVQRSDLGLVDTVSGERPVIPTPANNYVINGPRIG